MFKTLYLMMYAPIRCPLGYMTAKGWDAATGLGMPNMQVLTEAAIK